MNTFKGYINYGCLAAEKRSIFTAGNPHATAVNSDAVEFTIPDGWELNESVTGDTMVTSPWGWIYNPNELLVGKKDPYFAGTDKGGNDFRVKLDYRLL